MPAAQVQRARRYAFHFFFRRMIPLGFMQPGKHDIPYWISLRSFRELEPGRHHGLDVICEGILHNRPFIYPAEAEPKAQWDSPTARASAAAR
jgi:hypothetical protein